MNPLTQMIRESLGYLRDYEFQEKSVAQTKVIYESDVLIVEASMMDMFLSFEITLIRRNNPRSFFTVESLIDVLDPEAERSAEYIDKNRLKNSKIIPFYAEKLRELGRDILKGNLENWSKVERFHKMALEKKRRWIQEERAKNRPS